MKALRIVVTGLVQGVGFRPFIDRVVRQMKLNGYVRNVGGSEVEVWIEGNEEYLYEFLAALLYEKPPPALIDDVVFEEEIPVGYTGFTILKSSEARILRSNIPPDLAVCRHCLEEVLDPLNRRYMYPFNSCAWCGPRFSMMHRSPYDRENTSMSKYMLCDECLREYNDPENVRRHHAQGISCPRDGPRLALYDNDFTPINTRDPIKEAAQLIDEGYIVAVKGIGGYHIASLATDDEVVHRLRTRKKRPRKPFAVMGLDTSILELLVYMDERDREILESPRAPILLLPKREDSPVSRLVSPGLSHEGVFIAYTPLHFLLLMNTKDKFLIMTSGNVSGEPMCRDEECAKNRLTSIVDYFLVHDRDIVNRVDDSVIRKTGGEYVLLRRSRGYAPSWIKVPVELQREVIAFGGDLNNVGGIGFEDKIVLTQYIGDLESYNAQVDLVNTIEYLVRNYGVDSEKALIAVDKHPSYHSRRLGIEYSRRHGAGIIEIQHHYAHVFGVAVDRGLSGVVAGLAIDGVGWGDDSTIWGGEVLVFDMDKPGVYRRVASIDYIPLTSDRDTVKPFRLLYGYLAKKGWDIGEIDRVLGLRDGNRILEGHMVYNMVKRGRYTPASSTGRLIDIVASIIDPGIERSFEGEPAIRLEAMAFNGVPRLLEDVRFQIDGNLVRLDVYGVISRILEERSSMKPCDLAASFLYSIGYYYGELIAASIKGSSISNIVVSGGASVNEYIYRGLRDRLASEGLKPLLPLNIPPNDEGIAFGQVIVAGLIR
ncbi:MAG: carbamoyltransferase HypF [Desulfurococcus sp.]|uniref:carbamoyltransferase HypF n=1 Tax=Desulfurococcus sp. TaxID=51678 RepID=UPI003D0FA07E